MHLCKYEISNAANCITILYELEQITGLERILKFANSLITLSKQCSPQCGSQISLNQYSATLKMLPDSSPFVLPAIRFSSKMKLVNLTSTSTIISPTQASVLLLMSLFKLKALNLSLPDTLMALSIHAKSQTSYIVGLITECQAIIMAVEWL